MKMNSLISIIVPVYNVVEYLDKCMESLLFQTYTNIEIVVVNDGSTDKSYEKCLEYSRKDDRIKLYDKENGGLSDARNYGIKKATGEYVTCVDSDDYVDSDYIEYLYELICKYGTDVSVAQHRVVGNDFVKDFGNQGDEVLTDKECISRMLYHDVIDTSAWAKLYRRDMFDDILYPVGKLFEDISTTYKLFIKSGKVAVGYESKYNYVYRKTSIVNSKFNIKKLELMEMTDLMAKEVEEKYPDLKRAIIRRQVYSRISTLNQLVSVDGEYASKVNEIIAYIKSRAKIVITDKQAPMRDKIAIILLSVSYKLYKFTWKCVSRK